MKYIILVLMGLLLVVSCKNAQKNWQNTDDKGPVHAEIFYSVDLAGDVKENGTDDMKPINSIVDKVSYMILEDKRESLLSSPNFILNRVDDKYVVSSYNTGIMQFDRAGKFDRQLMGLGRAGTEIPKKLYTWNNNEQTRQITVVCGFSFIQYDYVEEEVNKYPLERYYFSIVQLNDTSYVALPNINGENGKERLYLNFLNSKGKVIKSVYYPEGRDVFYQTPYEYNGPLESYGLYATFDGCALFRDMFNDTIYKVVKQDDIKPYLVFHRGDFVPALKEVDNESLKRKHIYIRDVSETEKYIFIKYTWQDAVFCSVWNKSNGEVISKAKIDMVHRTPVFLNCRYFFNYLTPVNDNILIGIVSFTKNKLYGIMAPEDAIKFLPGVKEDSNPIVVEILLKEEIE